jgi:hypothetical protein
MKRGAIVLDEKQVRAILVCAFENLQRQNTVLYSLTTELEAVRDVLCEHAPAYKALLAQKRAHYVEEQKLTVADDFAKFEQIIQQLRET